MLVDCHSCVMFPSAYSVALFRSCKAGRLPWETLGERLPLHCKVVHEPEGLLSVGLCDVMVLQSQKHISGSPRIVYTPEVAVRRIPFCKQEAQRVSQRHHDTVL